MSLQGGPVHRNIGSPPTPQPNPLLLRPVFRERKLFEHREVRRFDVAAFGLGDAFEDRETVFEAEGLAEAAQGVSVAVSWGSNLQAASGRVRAIPGERTIGIG